jgi:hypothetical protein
VEDCFAYKGVARIGAIDGYQCGLFHRLYCWFDVLGVGHQASPSTPLCLLHHRGRCERTITFEFPTA